MISYFQAPKVLIQTLVRHHGNPFLERILKSSGIDQVLIEVLVPS